ncbi:GNAT family N-acetyltransferase [Sphingomonas sp.]|uniref:GNAT family N-acetyltransferase n=1 Tax=Sphingomonas sp. TaxID=28214 RepID=UPI0025EE883D|nr:GNAT family N-acetyltransferase [Sphingomonas sp.]
MEDALRFATLDDAPALHRLIESAYRGDRARLGWTHEADLLEGQRTDVEALSAILSDTEQRLIVAERNGVMIGCVQVTAIAGTTANIGHLSVEPKLQGTGLGRRLVAEAERVAVHHYSARLVEMTVIMQRPELIAWYGRLGFSPTGEHRPFPVDNPRFGIPRVPDLCFVVLAKSLVPEQPLPISTNRGAAR